jgi:hypothetical protein
MNYTFISKMLLGSQDRSVGIEMSYRLDRLSLIPGRERDFSLHHSVDTGSGAHPASYTMGTKGFFPRGKEARDWSSPLTTIYHSGQEWLSYTSTPIYIFMA